MKKLIPFIIIGTLSVLFVANFVHAGGNCRDLVTPATITRAAPAYSTSMGTVCRPGTQGCRFTGWIVDWSIPTLSRSGRVFMDGATRPKIGSTIHVTVTQCFGGY